MMRLLLETAVRERRVVVRAMRCDSTVVEADVRWPSDAALALDATRLLAREAKCAASEVGQQAPHVQDRSRAAARRLRLIGRTVGRRIGGARERVLELTGEAGERRACAREASDPAKQLRPGPKLPAGSSARRLDSSVLARPPEGARSRWSRFGARTISRFWLSVQDVSRTATRALPSRLVGWAAGWRGGVEPVAEPRWPGADDPGFVSRQSGYASRATGWKRNHGVSLAD